MIYLLISACIIIIAMIIICFRLNVKLKYKTMLYETVDTWNRFNEKENSRLKKVTEYEKKWISIDDKMPSINVTPGVLVGGIMCGIDVQPVYNNGKGEPTFQEGWRKGEAFEVTHWMPLPNLPQN